MASFATGCARDFGCLSLRCLRYSSPNHLYSAPHNPREVTGLLCESNNNIIETNGSVQSFRVLALVRLSISRCILCDFASGSPGRTVESR